MVNCGQILFILLTPGGMLLTEIESFNFKYKVLKMPDVTLGFHGHNNLGLGVANGCI